LSKHELHPTQIAAWKREARPHSALAGRTPDETYAIDREQEKLAA
jgi:hypothetical protein